MNKKSFGPMVLAACAAFIVGFLIGHGGENNKIPNIIDAPTFYATIEEVDSHGESSLLVQGLDINNWNYRSKYILWNTSKADLVWHGTKIKFDQFQAGQTISITFDGVVMESYPGQISNVYQIEILDDE